MYRTVVVHLIKSSLACVESLREEETERDEIFLFLLWEGLGEYVGAKVDFDKVLDDFELSRGSQDQS